MIRSLKRINFTNKSLVMTFINRFIRKGIKYKIYQIFFLILIKLKKRLKESFDALLNRIILIISPLIQLKPKFASGVIYLIPDFPKYKKSLILGLNFLVKAIKNRREDGLKYRIFHEFRDILLNKGLSLRYREEFHKLALANRHLLFKFQKKKFK